MRVGDSVGDEATFRKKRNLYVCEISDGYSPVDIKFADRLAY